MSPWLLYPLSFALALGGAWVGGKLAPRFGQPAVLGELVAGLVFALLGLDARLGLDLQGHTPLLHWLGEVGVVALLFEVGLETDSAALLRYGPRALLIAVIGVILPMALGTGVSALLHPAPWLTHLFIGATLAATSVGITARVFQDLGALKRPEAQLVLAAAVIDDVLGLLLLAMLSGVSTAEGGFGPLDLALLLAKVVGLGLACVLLARGVLPALARWTAKRRRPVWTDGLALAVGLLLAVAAGEVGLAAIVGAFAAGLALERSGLGHGGAAAVRHRWVGRVVAVLAPLFFVQVGASVELSALATGGTLLLTLGLVIAAIAGKLVCGLAAPATMSRLTVGLAMVPRGEVGLIFANLGLGLVVAGAPVLSPSAYAAAVGMVLVTTLITPPALRLGLRRRDAVASPESV